MPGAERSHSHQHPSIHDHARLTLTGSPAAGRRLLAGPGMPIAAGGVAEAWRRPRPGCHRARRGHPAEVGSLVAGGYTVDAAAAEQRESMAHGTVKWFNPDKGYGFIDPDDG